MSHRNRETLVCKTLLVKTQLSLDKKIMTNVFQNCWARYSTHLFQNFGQYYDQCVTSDILSVPNLTPLNLMNQLTLLEQHLASSVGSNTPDKSYFKKLFHQPGNPTMTAINGKLGDCLSVYCHAHHSLKKPRINIRLKTYAGNENF